MISPSGRVPEQGPDWFMVATEVCGGFFLGVSVFTGNFGIGNKSGGSPSQPRGREARPHPCGPLVAPLTDFFRLYMSIYPKNVGEQNRLGVSPPEASVATENQSDPFWHPAGGGNPSLLAIFIILVLSMTRREYFTLGAEGMY